MERCRLPCGGARSRMAAVTIEIADATLSARTKSSTSTKSSTRTTPGTTTPPRPPRQHRGVGQLLEQHGCHLHAPDEALGQPHAPDDVPGASGTSSSTASSLSALRLNGQVFPG